MGPHDRQGDIYIDAQSFWWFDQYSGNLLFCPLIPADGAVDFFERHNSLGYQLIAAVLEALKGCISEGGLNLPQGWSAGNQISHLVGCAQQFKERAPTSKSSPQAFHASLRNIKLLHSLRRRTHSLQLN